jgi:DNA-binding transcriptional ArsR family regulator
MKRLLWWLIAGSRGGVHRGQILLALKERPFNANQLSEMLSLDYKTIRHHLKVLEENHVITAGGPAGGGGSGDRKYGAMYFLTVAMEQGWKDFEEVWSKAHADAEKEGAG